MFDSVTFTTLILAEIIFILLIAIGLLLLFTKKQRQRQDLLIQEYKKLHSSVRSALHPDDGRMLDKLDKNSAAPDPIEIFLNHASKESQARFNKFTQAKIPRLSPELPFSAKVASLRYLYTVAEADIRKQRTTHDEAWMLFEKKLAEILRWIAPAKKLPAAAPNSRLRLLQEQVDTLKPFEIENVKLLKQLEQSQRKQKALELFQHDSKEATDKMQKIIRVLQLANSYKGENIQSKVYDALNAATTHEHWKTPQGNYQASIINLDSISDMSEQKYSLVRKIVDDLPDSYAHLNAEQRQKLEDTIRLLEKDMLKSDHHISNLQKELKAAKTSMMEQPLVITEKPVTPFNRYSPGKEVQIHPLPTDPPELPAAGEETLKVVHTRLADDSADESDEQPMQENQWVKGGGHARTLAEIQHLRSNNQSQRSIIIDLEKELTSLRQSMHETTDEAEKLEKNKDIVRMERLVKECEHCIEILESEVDLLHAQLAQTGGPSAPDDAKPEHEIEQLNQELETISNKLQRTVKQYSETNILNHFAVEALACTTIEELAKLLIKAVKELHLSAGFHIHSTLGQAEYFAGNSFTAAEQKIITQPKVSAPISYLNEGILFSRPGLQLMLRNPPKDDDEQMQVENTLTHLSNIASAQIKHLEINTSFQKQARGLNAWRQETKKLLTDMDMQYAHQTEQSRRILDKLAKELMATVKQMSISENSKTVLENTISEGYQQLNLLLESAKSLDQTSAQLISKLEKLHG